MLQVSDMLEVARGERGQSSLSPQRFQRDPRRAPVVVWNVLHHCNMRCPHCYAAASFRPSPTDLDHEEASSLVDSLAEAGVKILIFSGGEPLLRPDLFELIARARERGIQPHLSTNGVLIDEQVAGKLAALGVAYVGISIDGPREFNDGYRGMEGGFDAAVAGLRAAREAGMRTGLRLTLIRQNEAHLETMHQLAEELGVSRFYVSHLLYAGRGRNLTGRDLSRSEARAALLRLFALAEQGLERESVTRIVTGSNDSDGPFLLRWIVERYGAARAEVVRDLLEARGGNSAGEGLLNIDSRGRVHPDQFWTSEVLGDVREQPVREILKHPMRSLLADRAEHLTGRCGSCSYRALCRGSHRERALAVHGELWAPDPACVLEDAEIKAATLIGSAAGEERS